MRLGPLTALAALAGLAAVVMAVAGAAAPSGSTGAAFTTRGLITKLAVDGNQVAVKTTGQTSRGCGTVVVWTAPGRKSKTLPANTQGAGCGSILCRAGTGCVDELALGAGQVVWISRSGGNSLELRVIAAKLAGGPPKELEMAINSDGAAGNPEGAWVGQLLGGGSLLAYNSWRLVCDTPEEGCSWRALRVADEKLVRIAAGRRLVVKRGEGSRLLSALGGGRMAVQSKGAVTILGPSGARMATVPAEEGNPTRAVALSKTHLAVSRASTLDLYNPVSGVEWKSIALGSAATLRLVDVSSRLALLRGTRRLVLVRLADGKFTTYPLSPDRVASIVDARLTEAGLFYAHNVRQPTKQGRITFEAAAKLLSRF